MFPLVSIPGADSVKKAAGAVKDAATGAVDKVTNTVDFMTDPFGYIGKSMQDADHWLVSNLFPALLKLVHPDFSQDWFLESYKVSFAIAFIGMVFLLIKLMLDRAQRKISGEQLVNSLALRAPAWVVGVTFGPAIAAVLLSASGALADGAATWMGTTPTAIITSLANQINEASWTSVAGGALIAIVVFFLLGLSFCLVFLTMLGLVLAQYFLGVVFPIAWVWMIDPRQRHRSSRAIVLFIGFLLSPAAMFFALGFAYRLIGGLTMSIGEGFLQSITNLLVAFMALVIVTTAPFMLMKYMPLGLDGLVDEGQTFDPEGLKFGGNGGDSNSSGTANESQKSMMEQADEGSLTASEGGSSLMQRLQGKLKGGLGKGGPVKDTGAGEGAEGLAAEGAEAGGAEAATAVVAPEVAAVAAAAAAAKKATDKAAATAKDAAKKTEDKPNDSTTHGQDHGGANQHDGSTSVDDKNASKLSSNEKNEVREGTSTTGIDSDSASEEGISPEKSSEANSGTVDGGGATGGGVSGDGGEGLGLADGANEQGDSDLTSTSNEGSSDSDESTIQMPTVGGSDVSDSDTTTGGEGYSDTGTNDGGTTNGGGENLTGGGENLTGGGENLAGGGTNGGGGGSYTDGGGTDGGGTNGGGGENLAGGGSYTDGGGTNGGGGENLAGGGTNGGDTNGGDGYSRKDTSRDEYASDDEYARRNDLRVRSSESTSVSESSTTAEESSSTWRRMAGAITGVAGAGLSQSREHASRSAHHMNRPHLNEYHDRDSYRGGR